MIRSQRDKKNFLGCRRFTSQKGKERIYNGKFSKVNSLRKRRSVIYCQEACLKFSQT